MISPTRTRLRWPAGGCEMTDFAHVLHYGCRTEPAYARLVCWYAALFLSIHGDSPFFTRPRVAARGSDYSTFIESSERSSD